jgi:hypothetical protein
MTRVLTTAIVAIFLASTGLSSVAQAGGTDTGNYSEHKDDYGKDRREDHKKSEKHHDNGRRQNYEGDGNYGWHSGRYEDKDKDNDKNKDRGHGKKHSNRDHGDKDKDRDHGKKNNDRDYGNKQSNSDYGDKNKDRGHGDDRDS